MKNDKYELKDEARSLKNANNAPFLNAITEKAWRDHNRDFAVYRTCRVCKACNEYEVLARLGIPFVSDGTFGSWDFKEHMFWDDISQVRRTNTRRFMASLIGLKTCYDAMPKPEKGVVSNDPR